MTCTQTNTNTHTHKQMETNIQRTQPPHRHMQTAKIRTSVLFHEQQKEGTFLTNWKTLLEKKCLSALKMMTCFITNLWPEQRSSCHNSGHSCILFDFSSVVDFLRNRFYYLWFYKENEIQNVDTYLPCSNPFDRIRPWDLKDVYCFQQSKGNHSQTNIVTCARLTGSPEVQT